VALSPKERNDMKTSGVVLVALGLAALGYGALGYTVTEQIVAAPAIVGVAALVGGITLVLVPRRGLLPEKR